MSLLDGENPAYKGIVYEKLARDYDLAGMPAVRKQDFVRKFWRFVEFHPGLMELALDPELLAVVRSLIGETPLLFQDMALLKPPHIGREKPWASGPCVLQLRLGHPRGRGLDRLGRSHRGQRLHGDCARIAQEGGPVVHFSRRDWQICDTDARQDPPVAVPLPPGGVLFFRQPAAPRHPHQPDPLRGAGPFSSTTVRRAPGSRPQEKRLQVFGAEGKDVTC